MGATFSFSSENPPASRSVAYRNAAASLLNQGAFFSRPYGELATMMYERAAGYTMALKRLKKVFDPKNIMNPGNLCF